MQKSRKNKGFTLTELAIVIAVIAILIAVLVPTFTSLINSAKESSDSQLAKNMNTLLATAETDSDKPESMEEVNKILVDGGYTIAKLTPSADNNIFVWNEDTNRISYISTDDWTVIYAGDSTLTTDGAFDTSDGNAVNYWVTVESVSEINSWTGLSYYLYDSSKSFEKATLNFTVASGVDASSYSVKAIIYNTTNGTSTVSTAKTSVGGNVKKAAETGTTSTPIAKIRGSVETITVSNSNISVTNYATVETVTLTSVDVYTEVGSTTTLNVNSASASVVIKNNGIVATITTSNSTTVTASQVSNSGCIINSNLENVTKTNTTSYTYNISSYTELASFRDKVNNGTKFTGITVKLTANISLSGIDWVPIGFDSRDKTYTESSNVRTVTDSSNYKSFNGIFDGGNYTISGLSNTGFTPTVTRLDTYGTETNVENYLYGLFGIIDGATIKNLKLTNVNIVEEADSQLGDSVGAVAGYAIGSVKISNCTVSGSIAGAEGASGIVGRIYALASTASTVTIENCTNNATVTASEGKAVGIVGFYQAYVSGSTINITNCTNNGTVETTTKTEGYAYSAGIAVIATQNSPTITLTTCTNTGNIKADSGVGHAASLVNAGSFGSTVTLDSCSNTGTISAKTTYDLTANYGAATLYSSITNITISNT